MPHTLIKSTNTFLKTPFEHNGVLFDFLASSHNFTQNKRDVEYKVGVQSENKEFLLTLKQKGDSWLLKTDKATRVTPISTVKNAINSYAKAINAEVLFSNTNSDRQSEATSQKEYLKEIDYFVNEFTTTKQIELEIGFGSGRHLLYQAKQNPNVQYIGVEIHTPSIEQLLKQIKLQNVENILVVNYDARMLMEFLDSNSVQKIFVHFPVPWEKKPHRRVYSEEFVKEALRVLNIGGLLELRTDSSEYFEFSTKLVTNLKKAKIEIDINKDLEISSKYEDRWKKQGKDIYNVTLYAQEISKPKEINKEFSFKNEIDFEEFKKRFSNTPIKGDDFIVHFEDIFDIKNENNSGLIKLTFGSFNKPLNKYLYVKNGKIRYFQKDPIPTSANIAAHKKIEEIILND